MSIIFYNSSLSASDSMTNTFFITDWLSSIFKQAIFIKSEWFVTLIRKTAHFVEYFILGFLAVKSHGSFYKKYSILVSLLFCISYAFTDEIHQLFVSGRAFMLLDVFIDSIGALSAILLFRK
ncbi:MAG: VanZ family protein [Clostridiales bacterium]|nr:VanZ family protein [Clostridiales bacterium]